jgi:hypothetical protein
VARGREAEMPERIYTGFYGALSSEVMPYVEWGDGDHPFLQKFFQVFELKWENNKGNTSF